MVTSEKGIGLYLDGFPVRIETKVRVAIDDIEEYFKTEPDCMSYLKDLGKEISLYDRLGIWKLINSNDRRWGKNGFEHMGIERDNWERDRKYQGLSTMIRRARNYAMFVKTHQDSKAYDGMPYNDWIPIKCKEELRKSPLLNLINSR